MHTVSKAASKLLISETKPLDTVDIISPLVETSSSTATIESTTGQISSKLSSPLNTTTYRDSPKSSPLSESTTSPPDLSVAVIKCATSDSGGVDGSISKIEASNATNLLKFTISPDMVARSSALTLSSGADNLLLPFLSETFRKIGNINTADRVVPNSCGKMLSSAASTSSCQQAATKSTVINASLLSTTVTSPTSNIKNVKCEPYSTLSPVNENANSPNLLDETPPDHDSGNSTSNIKVTIEAAIKRERESSTSSTSMLLQNSNGSVNSTSTTANESSPNNGSDHSNSSNISSNISQIVGNNGLNDIKQDINHGKNKNKIGKANTSSGTNMEEEDIVVDKSNPATGSLTKNALSTTPTLNELTSVKEETDVLNIIGVKKEENIVSPDMSPIGFGSIPNLSVGSSIDGICRVGTPVKMDDTSNTASITNNNCNNNNNEKLSSVLGSIATNNGTGGTESVSASSGGGIGHSVLNSSNETYSIGNVQHPNSNTINCSNSSSSLGNCMEYMQQQNQIFVFSTQLANKGAESVLNGQFPTIIAYHCTQPATKNFLEDFFMKNPMKISKLQRQNSLSLCNISVGAVGQSWVGAGNCNTVSKITQKTNSNKINFANLKANIDTKSTMRVPDIASYGDTPDSIGNDTELMCWEQTRNSVEGGPNESHIKISNGVDSVAERSLVTNKGIGGPLDASDVNTPSLQGIKVPDENLTPQQRQHREEQLAKLKQIDQFLSNPLQGANQLSKSNNDGVSSNLVGIMLNLSGAGPGSMGPQISNPLNSSVHNMAPNLINQNNQGIGNPDSMPTTLGDGNVVPSDIIGAREISRLACNTSKAQCNPTMSTNNQPNLSCGPNIAIGQLAHNVNAGNMIGNSLTCHSGTGNINCPGVLNANSPEVMANFNHNCGSQDINHVGMAQMEWSKLQHQFYEERIKGNKPVSNDISCRSSSSGIANVNMRSSLTGACVPTPTPGNQVIRTSQGPPPPYHPTQRSASVPIATQSPNPTSPNNPTSNLSLPSPRTSGTLGITGGSPNTDGHPSAMSTPANSVVTTTTSTVNTTISNTNPQSKSNFQSEGSPTSGAGNSNSCSNNRNRNHQLNPFNSNPSTPLSHLSPKDMESFHTSVTAGDLKNARPSPQRSRTPLSAPNNGGNLPEAGNVETRFPSGSPGLNYQVNMPISSASNPNNYKGPGSLERQNSAPIQTQFCRPTDNLPLNPNGNRPPQNKLSHSFDPISSLAQMSQQLTSCVSLNTVGVGTSPGNMGVIGVNDINVSNNVNQNQMESMMGCSLDSSIDHCSSGVSGNISIPPHMNGPASFLSNNCHINSMLGPMGQRFLNPKMCSGFNPGAGGMRDGPGNIHCVMPTHRMMSRVAMNFGNFNVSPNIQVKASTPNTIQYMPVRPQNSNSNNMRLPPSLEFLRYANPQMTGAGNIMDSSHLAQGNPNGSNHDLHKIASCSSGQAGGGNVGLSFFGNCNQMGSMVNEHDDIPVSNMIPGHDMVMGAHGPMIRAMRPMRQHNLGHGCQMVTGPRMQAPPSGPPIMNSGGSMMSAHFGSVSQDDLECGGDSSMYSIGGSTPGNGSGALPGSGGSGQGHLYTGVGQQKPVKPIGGSGQSSVQNVNPTNVGSNGQIPANGSGLLSGEHNPAIQSPVSGALLMGSSGNIISNAITVGSNVSPVSCGGASGPGNNGSSGGVGHGSGVGSASGNGAVTGVGSYKPFVGPASNDLKYAQQYHSFQQQLYATSTRSQQSASNTNISSNIVGNPAFFVNK